MDAVKPEQEQPTPVIQEEHITPLELEEKKVELETVKEASKSKEGLIALALMNIKWIILGAVVIVIAYGITFSGCQTKWFTKSPTESPVKVDRK